MFNHDNPRCWQVYDFFVANECELKDLNFLIKFLTPHCKFKKLGMRGSHLRIVQTPRELARFLLFMDEAGITSYLEIGTSTGGSFTMIDTYLRATNPGFKNSVGYDRKFKLRDWSEYTSRFPTAEFRLGRV